ncbi:MAG: LPS export ABC transporter permease LptF [Rhodobacteraceae bacterium]|nr:LPS export ABC transporter permease LptF [Paracoccaceae bacterium]
MLNRLDRYFLAQLIGPFGFFALVIAGILWLAQALPLIDNVIESGQSGAVFLEITSYLLPKVLMVALPIAALSAALYALNRLYSESELVVMMTAGQSPMALARPVALFGLLVMALMAAVTLYLVPTSQTLLKQRMADFRSDFAKTLIREGQFLHPVKGLTIFIRDTSKQGEMAGLFLSDRRDAANPVVYTARKALLMQDNDSIRIVMIDGNIQRLPEGTAQLSTIHFDTFSYDIGILLAAPVSRTRSPFERFVPELIWPDEKMLASKRYGRADYLAEANHKLVMPLSALVLPLVALGAILAGGFRRGGFMGRVMGAIGIGLVVQAGVGISKSVVQGNGDLYWVMYMPALFGLIVAVLLLRKAGRVPRRRRRILP